MKGSVFLVPSRDCFISGVSSGQHLVEKAMDHGGHRMVARLAKHNQSLVCKPSSGQRTSTRGLLDMGEAGQCVRWGVRNGNSAEVRMKEDIFHRSGEVEESAENV